MKRQPLQAVVPDIPFNIGKLLYNVACGRQEDRFAVYAFPDRAEIIATDTIRLVRITVSLELLDRIGLTGGGWIFHSCCEDGELVSLPMCYATSDEFLPYIQLDANLFSQPMSETVGHLHNTHMILKESAAFNAFLLPMTGHVWSIRKFEKPGKSGPIPGLIFDTTEHDTTSGLPFIVKYYLAGSRTD